MAVTGRKGGIGRGASAGGQQRCSGQCCGGRGGRRAPGPYVARGAAREACTARSPTARRRTKRCPRRWCLRGGQQRRKGWSGGAWRAILAAAAAGISARACRPPPTAACPRSHFWPMIISGAIHAKVPRPPGRSVRCVPSCSRAMPTSAAGGHAGAGCEHPPRPRLVPRLVPGLVPLADRPAHPPGSPASLAVPVPVSSTLDDLMSRCTTPRACRKLRARERS